MINTNDKLSDDITLKRVVILLTCVIKDGNKFYPQLFLDHTLYDEQTQCNTFKKDINKQRMPVSWRVGRWEKKWMESIFADRK